MQMTNDKEPNRRLTNRRGHYRGLPSFFRSENEEVELSDELFDQSKYGYFASPLFHARVRKMNEAHESWPAGRAGRRFIEKKLGCKYADFIAFLESIVDDEGFAYVPTDDGGYIAMEIGRPKPRLPDGVSCTPLTEEVSEAIKGYSETVSKLSGEELSRVNSLRAEGRKNEAISILQEYGLKPLPAGFVFEGATGMLAQILDIVTLDPIKH
jgi:hypothetical protein